MRAAFDLYRLDLLKPLGYQHQPVSAQEERALWRRINVRLLYPDVAIDVPPYREGSMHVSAAPPASCLAKKATH